MFLLWESLCDEFIVDGGEMCFGDVIVEII